MQALMTVDPLTYGVAALRGVVWLEAGIGTAQTELSLAMNVGVMALAAVTLGAFASFLFSTAD
jgi:hypothetical protein